MNEAREYLMPDYYPDFHCKMGACRTACCEGWPISLSMKDYFNLLSLELSPDMRRKLDCGMHLAEHPMPEAYAHILPGYDGRCPMRMADGRCALHAEAGETVLADVCRLYPRGVRSGEVHEISCANSCEAVVEMLLKRREPIAFVKKTLDIKAVETPPRQFFFENAGREQEIRLWLISHVQNRMYSLPHRLLLLGRAIIALDEALKDRDEARIDALLSGEEKLQAPETVEAEPEQVRTGLEIAERMLEFMDERSDSIRKYGEAALKYFGSGENEFEKYTLARAHFEKMIPGWETWFENMIVNHMFFSQFPFQDRPVDIRDEFLGLCTVYMMLRFLCVGWMAGYEDAEAAVDAAAAAFRLIDHTEYDRYAAPVLKKFGHNDWSQMHRILCL